MLFVHGWGGSIDSLAPLTRLFTNHTCVTLDLPGFGKSELPEKDWGVSEYASLLQEFCKKLQLKSVIYFGHSFGGALGIYLSSHSDLIQKLILCNSSFKRSKVNKKSIFKFLPFWLKRLIYRILYPNSDSFKYPLIETNFRKIISQDLTEELPKINSSTLILCGEKDTDTPVSLAYELHQKIKGSVLTIVPDVTHGLPLKFPNLVFNEIQKFL